MTKQSKTKAVRPREEVEKGFNQNKTGQYRYAINETERFALLMEILLDIRDLLTK